MKCINIILVVTKVRQICTMIKCMKCNTKSGNIIRMRYLSLKVLTVTINMLFIVAILIEFKHETCMSFSALVFLRNSMCVHA